MTVRQASIPSDAKAVAWTERFHPDETKTFAFDWSGQLASGDTIDSGGNTWLLDADAAADGLEVVAGSAAISGQVTSVKVRVAGTVDDAKRKALHGNTYELTNRIAINTAAQTLEQTGLITVTEEELTRVLPELVVEDGSGKSNADSYASVETADDLVEKRRLPTEARDGWLKASRPERRQFLREATAYLERKYRGLWVGRRTKKAQALAWPQVNQEDADGFAISHNAVPAVVVETTVLVAAYLAGGLIEVTRTAGGSIEELSVGRGAVELTFGVDQEEIPIDEDMLHHLVTRLPSSGGSATFMRA